MFDWLLGRSLRRGDAVRTAKESDMDGELARSTMDGRDLGNGF